MPCLNLAQLLSVLHFVALDHRGLGQKGVAKETGLCMVASNASAFCMGAKFPAGSYRAGGVLREK